jgi:hypothetical protein
MKSEIVPRAPEALELAEVSTDALKKQLRDAIGITEQAIIRVAALWQELTRRGEDLSEFRFALAPFLLPVAQGKLLPALVVSMAAQPRALQRLAALPVQEQEELLSGKEIQVYKGDGQAEAKPLPAMTFAEIVATVRDGRILTKDEQALATKRSAASSARRGKGRPPRIVVRQDVGTVQIGTLNIDLERLLSALRTAGAI